MASRVEGNKNERKEAGFRRPDNPEQEQSFLVHDHDTQSRRARGPATVRPFHFRGRFLTAVALRIETSFPDETFYTALDRQLNETPQLLYDAPVVLDFGLVPEFTDRGRIEDLIHNLRHRNLLVFGAQSANDAQLAAVQGQGLIPIKVGRDTAMPKPQAASRSRETRAAAPANKIITSPVRSGQMVVAEHGDLTVVGSVASGAELVAAGSIHVYGTLRGRAMAGAHGDETARIFCQSLEAELLAIAGLYKTSETIRDDLRRRSIQVFLDDETLCVEAFE